MGIKFGKDPLAVEQNTYTTNILNAHINCEIHEQEMSLAMSNF